MRHLKSFNPLNRNKAHRRALYRNMAEALFTHERIRTTQAKAKEIRRIAEKLITKAKVRNLHNIRMVNRLIKDKKVLMKLFDEIAPRYTDRPGGYTRVIKLNRRKGDGAEMAYLELVEESVAPAKGKKKKKKQKKAAEAPKAEAKKDEIVEAEKEEKAEAKEEPKKEEAKETKAEKDEVKQEAKKEEKSAEEAKTDDANKEEKE
ncbi:MAG: 50S ribosomal protein L17 [Spirochaetes bacterium]|nr:50S ribosomal protein L17 [Spirochaetota bacterium]